MGKFDPASESSDRYVSFMNIDCYRHASEVIDHVCIVTKNPEYDNAYWQKFRSKIPQSYYDKEPDEKVLYLVCASVFYIEELFEESEYLPGSELLKQCEYDCC